MSADFSGPAPRWRRYLRFWRRDLAADTDDEIRLHLEARIDELTAGGLSRDAARAHAIEEFGDLDAVRGDLRAIDAQIARRLSKRDLFGAMRDDLRYTVRSLARSRGFVFMVVAAMALGLGLNAAMFTFIDEVFFRPPAGVRDPGSVRRVWTWHHRTADGTPFASTRSNVVLSDLLQRAAGDDAELATYWLEKSARIGRGEGAPTAVAAYTSTNYLSVLGARLERGRWFSNTENEFGAPTPVSVVSGAFAHRRSLDIGSQLLVNGATTTVIGVARDGFVGPDLDGVDVWLPEAIDTSAAGDRVPWWQSRNTYQLSLIARVPPRTRASTLVLRMTAALEADQRTQRYGDTLVTAALGPINEARGPGKDEPTVTVATRLAAVAVLVLIIACANVINLLLARAVVRRRELAIRVALGVARARLMRLLALESIVLALLAGAGALLAAYWGGTLLRVLLLPDTRWAESPVSWRIVAFTAGSAILAGLIVGIVPAIRASAPRMSNFLRGGDGGALQRSRLRAALVAAQSALALALLVMSLLCIASLRNVQGVDIGYDASRLLFASVRFETPPAHANAVVDRGLRQTAAGLAGIRGIESVAYATLAPMRGFSFITTFVNGDSVQRLVADSKADPSFNAVSSSYFRTVGTRLVRGRVFADGSRENAVVINERLAQVAWHGVDPIGQCMRFESPTGICYQVIGIVGDARRDHVIEAGDDAQFYLPIDNMPVAGWGAGVVIVRAEPEAMPAAVATVRARMREVFPTGEPVLKRMTEYLEPEYRPFRLGATLFTAFAVLALVVTLVGIYSTVAYGVEQRAHEFSIRVALGARARDVVRHVVGRELRVVTIGLIAGTAIVLAGGRFVASLLYGIQPRDVRVIGAVSVLLLLAAVVASLGPAWRAGRADPVSALRSE